MLPEPEDQKVALVRSLLLIGALPEAFFILGRFPWFLDVYPDLLSYMFRLVHHSLGRVYKESRPFSQPSGSPAARRGPASSPGLPSDYTPRRTLRWARLEEKDAGDGISYRYYWDD